MQAKKATTKQNKKTKLQSFPFRCEALEAVKVL